LSVKKFVQTLVNGVSDVLVSLPSPWWARKLSLNSVLIIVLNPLEVFTDLLFTLIVASYLACEWKERKKECEPREFNKDNVKGNHPKVC